MLPDQQLRCLACDDEIVNGSGKAKEGCEDCAALTEAYRLGIKHASEATGKERCPNRFNTMIRCVLWRGHKGECDHPFLTRDDDPDIDLEGAIPTKPGENMIETVKRARTIMDTPTSDEERGWRRARLVEKRAELAKLALRGDFDEDLPQHLMDRLDNTVRFHEMRRRDMARALGVPEGTSEEGLIDAAAGVKAELDELRADASKREAPAHDVDREALGRMLANAWRAPGQSFVLTLSALKQGELPLPVLAPRMNDGDIEAARNAAEHLYRLGYDAGVEQEHSEGYAAGARKDALHKLGGVIRDLRADRVNVPMETADDAIAFLRRRAEGLRDTPAAMILHSIIGDLELAQRDQHKG